jgi:hypothetical protein
MENEVCTATARDVANKLKVGAYTDVDPRPCVNNALSTDPRFNEYVAEGVKAHEVNSKEGQFSTYEKIYRDISGPAQTAFWKSIVQQSAGGLCQLRLSWSTEYPGIIDHVTIAGDHCPQK